MIGKFSQGSKKAVEKLNRVVSEANKAFDVKTTQGATSPYSPNDKIYVGKVDYVYTGYFTGTFLDSEGNKVGATSPWYQQTIYTTEDNRFAPLVDSMFFAIKSRIDHKWYCIGIYNATPVPNGMIKVFRIYAIGTGAGVYSCREQILDETQWSEDYGADKLVQYSATSVAVFNIGENGQAGHQLDEGDILIGFRTAGDEGHNWWLGFSPKFAWFHD
jgi:hypothetical protein